MAKSVDSLVSETKSTPIVALKGHVYTMMAAFAGVIFGILGSLGFIGNYMQSQFAAQTASLNKSLVSVAPASDVTACVAPSGTSSAKAGGKGAGMVTAAAMPAGQQAGGKGADEGNGGGNGGGSQLPFVSQLVNGSISDTGPGSSNSINATNSFRYTAINNNNVNVSNSSSQTSTSGSANTSGNTNAGSSQSGNSDNQNSESTWVSVNN